MTGTYVRIAREVQSEMANRKMQHARLLASLVRRSARLLAKWRNI